MPNSSKQARRERLAAEMEEAIYQVLDAIDGAKTGREARELAEALGALVDGLLTLKGKPTTKTETRKKRPGPAAPSSDHTQKEANSHAR